MGFAADDGDDDDDDDDDDDNDGGSLHRPEPGRTELQQRLARPLLLMHPPQ